MMHTIRRGIVPGSDTAHLSLMGYDPYVYYSGRGPVEAAGVGFKQQDGDVAFRGNLGTVDEELIIKDRRAGRLRDVSPFVPDLQNIEIDGIKFFVEKGTAHRVVVVMRGEGLSSEITDIDPHVANTPVWQSQPKDPNDAAALKTANALNKFTQITHEILAKNPENKKRIADGQLPANYILLRGGGMYKTVPPFQQQYGLKAACVAGGGLYKGIGRLLGMDVVEVEGANALPDTNLEAKISKTISLTDDYDFVFLHVKAADSLGEDKKPVEKKEFIERIDGAAKIFTALDFDETLLVVTADHSTPCNMGKHSADPVPVLYCTNGMRLDEVSQFNEIACASGGLGFFDGKDLIPQALNLTGQLGYFGA